MQGNKFAKDTIIFPSFGFIKTLSHSLKSLLREKMLSVEELACVILENEDVELNIETRYKLASAIHTAQTKKMEGI